jgi:hypothetical protein
VCDEFASAEQRHFVQLERLGGVVVGRDRGSAPVRELGYDPF